MKQTKMGSIQSVQFDQIQLCASQNMYVAYCTYYTAHDHSCKFLQSAEEDQSATGKTKCSLNFFFSKNFSENFLMKILFRQVKKLSTFH